MKRGIGATVAIVVVGVLGAVAVLSADRLVLRDGRRIDGQLLSVQRGVIEFREDRGRVIQVPRDDVERIELHQYGDNRDYRDDRDNRDTRDPDRSGNRPRPNGLREREVWVAGNAAWTDTGIDLRSGQSVFFDTHGGDIQWKAGSHAKAGGDTDDRGYDRNRPLPNRPIGALIGKMTAGGRDYFFIGEDDGAIRVRGDGRLFLGINDSNVSDNRGAFRVTIYY